MTFEEEPEIPEEMDYFNELYQENDVETVGEWINDDNPKEVYFITGYRDEAHYEEFTNIAQQDEKYREISKKLDEMRESIDVINLRSTTRDQ